MTDENKPFKPPEPLLPPGMTSQLPSGQVLPGGTRGNETPLRDLSVNPAMQQPAMPIGQGINAVNTGSRLTASERDALKRLGWKEGEPIPVNMAELLQGQAAAPVSDIQLPASSGDIERTPLSAEAVTRGAGILSEAQASLQQAQDASEMQADDSVQRAIAAASGTGAPDVEIVDDTDSDTYDDGKPKAEAGADPPLATCPHCEWDLRLRDPIKVTDEDKARFLQSLLGQLPFQKSFSVLGGALTIVYRSLSPRELDSCFEQAYLERQQGKYQSPDAYYEMINRYRLALQLVRITSEDVNHTFPQSVEAWKEKLGPSEIVTTDLTVKRVNDFVFEHVIRTESLNRILGGLTGEFNSLVAKLEANTNNPDFWSATSALT